MMEMNSMMVTDKQGLWHERISSWERSGLTQPEYCKQHNLTVASFGNWRTRLKRLAETSQADSAMNFIPVKVCRDNHKGLLLKLHDYCSVEVQPGFNQDLLVDVIKTVQLVK